MFISFSTLKVNTLTFIFFTLSGTHTRAYGLTHTLSGTHNGEHGLSETHTRAYGSIILQLPKHLLTLTIDRQQRGSLEFILTSVGLAWHGRLFRDRDFIRSSQRLMIH